MKPLNIKAYGSIPHISGSRRGPGDHKIDIGQEIIATQKARDKHDLIIVTEKLDGSCCAVAKHDGQIIALSRSGYLAYSSKYKMHHFFARWVELNYLRFNDLLNEGERIVGEWIAVAHGTIYELIHEPFVVFDLFDTKNKRIIYNDLVERSSKVNLILPRLIHKGGPISVEKILSMLEPSGHGALEEIEGAVWRVERREKYDFLCKFVRQNKIDGKYLDNEIYNKNFEKYMNM